MTTEFRAGVALSETDYGCLLRDAVFKCCKWNLSSHDTETLCRFPILVSRQLLSQLSRQAEALAAEALAAEAELLRRDFDELLALPTRTARFLRGSVQSGAPRFLRVDFHPTPDGYRITEANTDVAGGFIEGAGVSALWEKLLNKPTVGDPAGALATAFIRRFGSGARIGFMHLTKYTDDRQIITYLARRFSDFGLQPILFDARQLRGGSNAIVGDRIESFDGMFRFFPGEWLEKLPKATAWRELVTSTVVSNPVSAMLTQSKRFPLAWTKLDTPMTTWRALMPETFSPETVKGDDWVLKPAFGHEGFGVSIPGTTSVSHDAAVKKAAHSHPNEWIAQRRFEFLPIETPFGPRFACLGIYVIDGKAAGAYARIGGSALIDDGVQDAVVLLEDS